MIGMQDLFLKKERADGGISYAMYFIGIVTCIVLYVFLKFDADLYMVEECLENGIHIAESRILTVNHDPVVDGKRGDTFERELSRAHIVTKYDSAHSTVQTGTGSEAEQIRTLGDAFSDAVKEQLSLDDNSHPTKGILKTMCGEDSVIHIEEMVIYEPVYEKRVTASEGGTIDGSGGIREYNFDVSYTPTHWIKYTLSFNPSTNRYDSSSLTKTIAPVSGSSQIFSLKNGEKLEGATVEATLSISFKGIRNIFAGVNTRTPSVINDQYRFDMDGTVLKADGYDMTGTGGPMFSQAPVQELTYEGANRIFVTQASDIVFIQNDERTQ